jgi:dihydroflavonol-4-reductase
MMDAALHSWSGRQVAITGASGFVGSHVARQLASGGARVVALVRASSVRRHLAHPNISYAQVDLADPGTLAPACSGCEIVFHLAGIVDFTSDWERLFRINVQGTRAVLAAARAAGVRRFIHTSSIVAVGATRRPCIQDETAAWKLDSLRVPYVMTKRIAEQEILAASGKGLETVVVNPGCVVGPDDFSGSEFGTLSRRFWRGRVPFHFGAGNNFVDVRDVAAGHLQAAQKGRPGQRYILGGHNRTYTALFADLARVASRPIFRVRMPTAVGTWIAALFDRCQRGRQARPYLTSGQARLLALFFYFSSSKARRELGYQPRSLRQSLADSHGFWMGPESAA